MQNENRGRNRLMENVPKKVIVAGLGLIGGSMAKAVKEHTDCRVLGWNRTRSVAEKALEEGAIDGIANEEDFRDCDLLMPVLYPQATISFLLEKIPQMKKGALAVDLVGIKSALADAVVPAAQRCGVHYVGGHPMAGKPKTGFERSSGALFDGANMVLVPTDASTPEDLEMLQAFFLSLGFGYIKLCSAKEHDLMIAHTSQLAHIVSNSYVKSPVSAHYVGFTGGSYKDMTRVAGIDEVVWSELFLLNSEALLPEIDALIANISRVRYAIEANDRPLLEYLLQEGRKAKESIDAANPNQPSD